ncbi:DUF5133 domain-containing protein [Streptomyces sp. NPDC001414]
MLMPHPATLRSLLTEYESLHAVDALLDDTAPGRRLQDLAYTLCVSTGTREIAHALHVARDYLDHMTESTAGTKGVTGSGPARTVIAARPLDRSSRSTPVPHS